MMVNISDSDSDSLDKNSYIDLLNILFYTFNMFNVYSMFIYV